MKIYNSEIKDGLQDTIMANKTIAMDCMLSKLDVTKTPNLETKAKASIGQDRDFDLYYLSSVLASVGSNKNDDTFMPEELWAAKETPIHKQFNYGHNEKDIIGCIFDSFLVDASGEIIESEDRIKDIQDICTYSAIWTKWGDSDLQHRMDQIIAAIENNELYVSMEALFKEFDYLLTNEAESKIVTRSEATSFLTKHLKSFGGSGEFNNYAVKRVIRNFTFSGKGLVENPANKRSVIDPNMVIISKGSENKDEGTFNMSDVLEKQIADLQTQLTASNKLNEELKASQAKEKETLISAKIQELEATVAELSNQNKELTSLAEDMKKDSEDKKAEMEDAEAKLKAELKEKTDQIKAMEQAKVVAERVAQLVEAGQPADKAKQICETWASSDDTQFATLVDLYKVETSTASDDSDSGDTTESTEASETEGSDFEDITDKTVANLNNLENIKDESLKAIAEEISLSLFANDKE